MKKRMLAFVMTICMLMPFAKAVDITPYRASDYLVGYGVALTAVGDGEMRITYDVDGKGPMKQIGVEALYIDYYDNGAWWPYDTLLGIKNPDFYAYDALGHFGYAYFNGKPGVKYRVTLKAYAQGYDGGFDTGNVTSYEKECIQITFQ